MPTGKHRYSALSLKQQAYVETIGEMVENHGHAHVSVLAERLGVSKPSVVQMLGRLSKLGIVKREGTEVLLTAAGRRLANSLGDKHALLREFMVNELGMDQKTADTDACRLEHVVSPAFVRKLRRFHNELTRRRT